jgi:NADH-quinone oxidoreductase subunit C
MNPKTEREAKILEEIGSKFDVNGKIQRERRIWISIDKDNLIYLCNWLKIQGFEHLSAISVIDWIKEERFEVTYHLWSYKDKILLTLKTKVDRKEPSIKSVNSIWEKSAQIHERELHELFGVKFEGNPDLSPLFLEDWHGPPPFRKDFDWRNYVGEKFYNEENERENVYYD